MGASSFDVELRGLVMRLTITVFTVLAGLSFVSGASAFQETPATIPGKAKVGVAKDEKTPLIGGEVELDLGEEGTPADTKKGSEVTLPGIGKIGVLPKLDFGLELLYGANNDTGEPETRPDEDVTIRGRLKHRF